MKVAVILLTWKRIQNLKYNLTDLTNQTYKDFDVIVSNGNLNENAKKLVDRYTSRYPQLNVTTRHDGNEIYTFRRFTIGRDLYSQGYDVILYIDDDIRVPINYVEKVLEHYKPKTYQSGYTWRFNQRGRSYYKNRIRVFNNEEVIHYCGTGMSVVDASIFSHEGLFDPPEGGYKIEDLWLSYYAQSVLGWQLKNFNIKNVKMPKVSDSNALYREVKEDRVNKDVFLRTLVSMGWEIPD